jgi:hypothetical protein
LRRNITKSFQIPQSNSKNASLAKESRSNDRQPDSDSSRPVPASRASGASIKSRTTSVNGVAVVRSGNTNSKSKKPSKKSRAIEISDTEDDDSLERDAALESPAKGAELRKATKVSKGLYLHYLYCLLKICDY